MLSGDMTPHHINKAMATLSGHKSLTPYKENLGGNEGQININNRSKRNITTLLFVKSVSCYIN